MDVFEKLNRKFGAWYEGLFGGSSDGDLRPRDILRRIVQALEDQRREGLDGQIYVPNHYVLHIAVADDDERQYVHAFLDADEMASAVRRYMDQHNYRTRGGLRFEINETAAPAHAADGESRVVVRCRFDAAVPQETPGVEVVAPEDVGARHAAPAPPARPLDDYDDEPGTVQALALASLTVRQKDGHQEVYPLTTRPLQIGRSRQAGNDVLLAGDGMVSKQHARIAYQDGQFVLYDLGSTNGTFVNDAPVEDSRVLQPGDEVRLGETRLLFRTSNPRPSPPAPAPAPAVESAAARLVAGSGEMYPLASQMTVGRALTSDIALIGDGVAARHAQVSARGDQVFVEDLGTEGGTFVNGERIPPRFPVALYDGDTVSFGSVPLRLARGAAGGGAR